MRFPQRRVALRRTLPLLPACPIVGTVYVPLRIYQLEERKRL